MTPNYGGFSPDTFSGQTLTCFYTTDNSQIDSAPAVSFDASQEYTLSNLPAGSYNFKIISDADPASFHLTFGEQSANGNGNTAAGVSIVSTESEARITVAFPEPPAEEIESPEDSENSEAAANEEGTEVPETPEVKDSYTLQVVYPDGTEETLIVTKTPPPLNSP